MKLSSLKPRITVATPTRLSVVDRRKVEPGREWYNTKEWNDLRLRVFERDMYTCKYPGCGRLEGNTSLLVAHHKKPHKGNKDLFWDENNIETVCKPCHDGPISSRERMSNNSFTWY